MTAGPHNVESQEDGRSAGAPSHPTLRFAHLASLTEGDPLVGRILSTHYEHRAGIERVKSAVGGTRADATAPAARPPAGPDESRVRAVRPGLSTSDMRVGVLARVKWVVTSGHWNWS